MFEIEMMPAAFGDSILVRYGSRTAPHHVLIDGGLEGNWRSLRDRLASIGTPCPLDLLVITHIDKDHIGGVVRLLEEAPGAIAPRDVWFNGKAQLEAVDDRFGVAQGERLSERIAELRLPHNLAFDGGPVLVPDHGALPRKTLPGGAVITLLSPGPGQLRRLLVDWERALNEARLKADGSLGPDDEAPPVTDTPTPDDRLGDTVRELADGEFEEDDTRPNGSSIAFAFEWDGRRVLFGADAFPSVLRRSIERMGEDRPRFDAFKVSHHGSRANTDVDLLASMRCPAFLVSTNGASYGHPDDDTIARILIHGQPSAKRLFFNYTSDRNRRWGKAALKGRYGYEAFYPDADESGIVIEL